MIEKIGENQPRYRVGAAESAPASTLRQALATRARFVVVSDPFAPFLHPEYNENNFFKISITISNSKNRDLHRFINKILDKMESIAGKPEKREAKGIDWSIYLGWMAYLSTFPQISKFKWLITINHDI